MKHNPDRLREKVESIKPLPAEDFEQFCAAAKPIECKKGHLLLKEGEVCKRIYFVESGYLRSFHTQDGLEINTGLHFEGSFVTHLKSLLTQQSAESFIAAGEPAFLYAFTRDTMMELYARSSAILEFGKKLLEDLAIQQEDHLNLFKLYSAEERFRYVEKNHPEILQRVPLSWLASWLGVARETLSRFRNK